MIKVRKVRKKQNQFNSSLKCRYRDCVNLTASEKGQQYHVVNNMKSPLSLRIVLLTL